MLLGGGELGNKRILKSETVDEMSRNQIGELTIMELRSSIPQFAKDPSCIPGSLDKFGLGFGINSKPVEGGRSGGSVAWAGIYNTFFWIDPPQRTVRSNPHADTSIQRRCINLRGTKCYCISRIPSI